MPVLSPKVLREIAQIIHRVHTAVAAVVLGKKGAPEEWWAHAVKTGLVEPTATGPGLVEQLHLYGATLAAIEQTDEGHGRSLSEIKDAVAEHGWPRSPGEQAAAEFSARHVAHEIVGLGNKIGAEVGSSLIEADKKLDKKMRSIMRDAIAAKHGDEEAQERMTAAGVKAGAPEELFEDEFRATTREIASDIGHATNDWTRDLQRIAQTEGHRAVEGGLAAAWEAQEDERAANGRTRPVLVYKLPRPGACKHCIRLHLDGDTPRIYTLAELTAHGSNYGRKAAEWEAVVGPVHPWCGCALMKVPATIAMPKSWRSGEAAPTVIGPSGRLVF